MATGAGSLLGLIIGATIGSLLLFAVIGVTCFIILKGSRRQKRRDIYHKNLLQGPIPTISQASSKSYYSKPSSQLNGKVWSSGPPIVNRGVESSGYGTAMPRYLKLYGDPWRSETGFHKQGPVSPLPRKERPELYRWPRAVYQAKIYETPDPDNFDTEEIVTPMDEEVEEYVPPNMTKSCNDKTEQEAVMDIGDSTYETVTVMVDTSLKGAIKPSMQSTTHVSSLGVNMSQSTSQFSPRTPGDGQVRMSSASLRSEKGETGKRVTTSAFEFLESYDDDALIQRESLGEYPTPRPQSSVSQREQLNEDVIPELEEPDVTYAVVHKKKEEPKPDKTTVDVFHEETNSELYAVVDKRVKEYNTDAVDNTDADEGAIEEMVTAF